MSEKFSIEGSVLKIKHGLRNPDKARQFKIYEKEKNNMRSPTLEQYFIEDFCNFFGCDNEILQEKTFVIAGANYKFDVNKFKKHIQTIKNYFSESIFQGSAFKYDKLDLNQDYIFGDISYGLRSTERSELVLNIGKHTAIKNIEKVTEKQKIFESFVFGGLFGGEWFDGVNYNFVEIHIDSNSKEIYHYINEETLNQALKAIETWNKKVYNFSTSEELDHTLLDESFDLTQDQNKVLFERVANLSKIHNSMQTSIKNICLNKNWECASEYLGRIDLFIKRKESYLIEIKTSIADIFKAVGQVLTYEKLLDFDAKKIIIVSNYDKLDNFLIDALNSYNIEIYSYEDFIQKIELIIL